MAKAIHVDSWHRKTRDRNAAIVQYKLNSGSELFPVLVEGLMNKHDKTKWHLLAPKLPDLFASCTRDAQTLVQAYDGFDDLEDEDHDGDADEEDVRRSWDPDEECVDELLT